MQLILFMFDFLFHQCCKHTLIRKTEYKNNVRVLFANLTPCKESPYRLILNNLRYGAISDGKSFGWKTLVSC